MQRSDDLAKGEKRAMEHTNLKGRITDSVVYRDVSTGRRREDNQ